MPGWETEGSSSSSSSGGTSSGDWLASMPSAGSFQAASTPLKIDTADVGRFNIDVTAPTSTTQSLAESQNALQTLIAGLGEALFGKKTGIVNAFGPPGAFVGDVVRGATTQVPVLKDILGLPAGVLGNVFGAAETVLSRIPTGWTPGGTDQMFALLPDSPEKRAVELAANKDVLYGANLKYDYALKLAKERPGLFPEIEAGTAGSLGGALASGATILLSTLGRLAERVWAGASFPSGSRLDEINRLAVSDLTSVESTVVQKIASGEWTHAQALDYLAANGSGFSHDALTEIILSAVVDPLNVLSAGAGRIAQAGRLAKSAAEAGKLAEASRIGRLAYAGQASELGPLFKGIRTIIDPLSYFSGRSPGVAKAIDATTDASFREALHVGWGAGNVLGLHRALGATGIAQDVMNNLKWALENMQREFIPARVGDNLMASAGFGAIPEDVMDFSVKAVSEKMTALTRKEFNDFTAFAHKVAERNVNVDDLAARMMQAYGQDIPHWKAFLAPLNDEQRSLLHLSTYNAVENSLSEVVRGLVQLDKGPDLRRIVLGNVRHLDETAAGVLLKAIKAAKTPQEKIQKLADAAARYDSLAGMLKFRRDDMAGSIERAIKTLDDLVTHHDLPRLMTKEEIAKYPALKAWVDAHPSFKIAFRPPDDRLARVLSDSEGRPVAVNLWGGHVNGHIPTEYVPGFEMPRNVLGIPVSEGIAKGVTGAVRAAPGVVKRPLDWIDVVGRSLRQQVSGAVIKVNAERRLEAMLMAPEYGLSKDEARAVQVALDKATKARETTMRALSGQNMWEALGGGELLPERVRQGMAAGRAIGKRDFTLMVLKAYEGDMRFVGLTQKFTGRLKALLAKTPGMEDFAGGNFAGQFSEGLYPALRFRWHPGFQAQEGVESWVLNAQRGVPRLFRGEMTAEDRQLARLWEHMVNSRLIGMTDFDMAEFSSATLAGGRLGKALEEIPNLVPTAELDTVGGATGIARQKRINYLRLYKSKLGPDIRAALGEERFLAFKRHYGLVDDNDVALRYINEQMDQALSARLTPDNLANYKQTIANLDLWQPGDLGALRPLNLDTLAWNLGGRRTGEKLREALTRGEITLAEIEERLVGHGAAPEYIRRVKAALEFDLPQFWTNVRDAYHLTDAEYTAFRSWIEGLARSRGLSPLEYLSGNLAHNVRKVETGGLAGAQAIKDQVRFLRAIKGTRKSHADDLYTEMARALKPHLDRSAVRDLRAASGIGKAGAWGDAHYKWLGQQMKQYVENGAMSPSSIVRPADFVAGAHGDLHGPFNSPQIVSASLDPTDPAAGYFHQLNYGPSPSSGTAAKLHVAADPADAQRILEIVDTVARRRGVTYKFVSTTRELADGAAFGRGGVQQGKFITIYPMPGDIVDFTKELDTELAGLGRSAALAPGEVPIRSGSPITHRNEAAARGAANGGYDARVPNPFAGVTFDALANPDVERALQWMAKSVNESGIVGGSDEWQAIMAATRKIDTTGAVPHNYTEQLVLDSVLERMKELEQDAYRTHYFARTRSVLERSINHPFFGLYPASYMWGKMLPEMVRFIAKEPVGVRTGALAYTLNDIRSSVAMQRELDPEFDKMMEGLGHGATAMLLSYMVPAVPWDIPAVAPGWMREIAAQGEANRQRVAAGRAPENFQGSQVVKKVTDYLNPWAADAAKLGSAGKEIGDTLLGNKKQQLQRGGPQVTIPGINAKIGGTNNGAEGDLTNALADTLKNLQSALFDVGDTSKF